jgi:hypothetical protein
LAADYAKYFESVMVPLCWMFHRLLSGAGFGKRDFGRKLRQLRQLKEQKTDRYWRVRIWIAVP